MENGGEFSVNDMCIDKHVPRRFSRYAANMSIQHFYISRANSQVIRWNEFSTAYKGSARSGNAICRHVPTIVGIVGNLSNNEGLKCRHM